MTSKPFLLAVPMALASMPAFAHPGVHGPAGFVDGVMHPVSGLDHALAMLTVGLLAALLGGRARWAVPASFVAMMAVGGALGMAGIEIPAVEAGIAASVVVLGAVVASGPARPVPTAMALAGAFAVFHGYAHGVEMPAGATALPYGLGFILATVLLHAAGLSLGLAVRGRQAIRAAGAAVAVAGLILPLV